MIEETQFQDSEQFLSWWQEQNPADELDMQEALTIFYHTETYDLGAI